MRDRALTLMTVDQLFDILLDAEREFKRLINEHQDRGHAEKLFNDYKYGVKHSIDSAKYELAERLMRGDEPPERFGLVMRHRLRVARELHGGSTVHAERDIRDLVIRTVERERQAAQEASE